MQDNNRQDIPQQPGYEALSEALTSLATNVMRSTLDVSNRIQDSVCTLLISAVQNLDRQLTEQINSIGDRAVEEINSTLQEASIRLNHEVASASQNIQNEIENGGEQARRNLRVRDDAEAELSDDEDNARLQRNMGNWSDKGKVIIQVINKDFNKSQRFFSSVL